MREFVCSTRTVRVEKSNNKWDMKRCIAWSHILVWTPRRRLFPPSFHAAKPTEHKARLEMPFYRLCAIRCIVGGGDCGFGGGVCWVEGKHCCIIRDCWWKLEARDMPCMFTNDLQVRMDVRNILGIYLIVLYWDIDFVVRFLLDFVFHLWQFSCWF